MSGMTTRWAMRIVLSMWPAWSGPRCEPTPRRTVGLYRGDGGLLGLHADRWRAADAGAAAFSYAWLQPGATGLSVRALRDRGHGHQPVGGLDRGAVRADGDAVCGARASGGGAAGADAARSGVGAWRVGGLRDGG